MTALARLKRALHRFEHHGQRASPHGSVTRTFHWLAGALLIYGLFFAADVADLSDPVQLSREIAFALVLGCLFVIRLLWVAFIGGGSRLPTDAPQ